MTIPIRSDAFIDGRWTSGAKRFPVLNPATLNVIAEAPDLGAAETEAAIAAAHAALPGWAGLLAADRGRLVET
ncbi:MAG: aldehyde dehydrogenase family protein, partial [Hyphomonadaceae bacterium]